MPETSLRDRKTKETRARIAEAALDLFVKQGYAETTVDQIAWAADVSRRTLFLHFPNKAAMLFDHLVGQREATIQRLRARPTGEAVLVSLHAVLRELCEEGYDRRLLRQVRTVLDIEPEIAASQLSLASQRFQRDVVATLEERTGRQKSSLEVKALTVMALGWMTTASHIYLVEGRSSLVKCFDQVVATCGHATTHDLGKSQGTGRPLSR
jgi:AcrR family transcriptional regulator